VLSDGDGNPRQVTNPSGYFKASNAGSWNSVTGAYHEFNNDSAGNQSLWIRNTSATPYGLWNNYSGAAPNGTGNQFIACYDTGGDRFGVRSNGGIANYSGNNVNLSDRREKENIEPAKNYLDVICSIPVVTFNYIDQNRITDDGKTLGVIAQDVQAVAPEFVMESNWAGTDQEERIRLSLYQTDLTFAMMKAIQELKAEVDSLKQQLGK
jgi:hypothetical protein